MFRKIVWATDGSELAEQALPVAKSLAWRDGAELVVLHVDQMLVGRAAGYALLADEVDIGEKLKGEVAQLRADGIDASLEITGSTTTAVADEIAQVARDVHADLIVISTHARGAVGTLVHGSVAKKLLHHAPCAVLVVPVVHLATEPKDARSELPVRVPS